MPGALHHLRNREGVSPQLMQTWHEADGVLSPAGVLALRTFGLLGPCHQRAWTKNENGCLLYWNGPQDWQKILRILEMWPTKITKNAKTKTQTCREIQKELENLVFHKNLWFHNSGWNCGGLGVSGGRAWTIRRHCLELWPGLVLHGIGKYTFQHLTVNWKVASWQNTSELAYYEN